MDTVGERARVGLGTNLKFGWREGGRDATGREGAIESSGQSKNGRDEKRREAAPGGSDDSERTQGDAKHTWPSLE